MPKFIDHHPKMDMSKMPPEAVQKGQEMLKQLRSDILAKRADRFGMTTINVYLGSNGESWCITDAPSVDAVLKTHESNGVKLSRSDVTEVTPLA